MKTYEDERMGCLGKSSEAAIAQAKLASPMRLEGHYSIDMRAHSAGRQRRDAVA